MMNSSVYATKLYEQFACLCVIARRQAKADRLDLPAEALAQAGATIRKNLEALGYGE